MKKDFPLKKVYTPHHRGGPDLFVDGKSIVLNNKRSK